MSVQPENTSQQKAGHWYIKKAAKVTGPFPAKLIGSYLILGRIDLDTQVSPDQNKWIPISKLPSLIPDEVKNAHTAEGKLALRQARQREDERTGESRRDVADDRRAAKRLDEDRRAASDRRQNNEVVSAAYQKLKADLSLQNAAGRRRVMMGFIFLVCIIVSLGVGFYVTEPAMKITKTDCDQKPFTGVDWQSCNKSNVDLVGSNLSNSNLHSIQFSGALLVNANLAGANLSYATLDNANLADAVLENAILKGSSLNNTNLTGVSLVGADLSYANLKNAILKSVKVLNTRFDHAIWTDGRTCAKGSIDQCLTK